MSRIIFMGTGEFAVPILLELNQHFPDSLSVITPPDKLAGRKKELKPPLVKTAAEELGIPVYQPERLREPEVAAEIRNFAPDVIVVAEYGKLIPKDILEIPRRGTINVHPSLLPKYRGPSPVQSVVLNGDDETGVSIILLDEEMDHGPILAQTVRKISSEDDALSLTIGLAEDGAKLLVSMLPDWVAGKLEPKEQDHSAATFTKLLTREDGRIDWARSAEEIARKTRAYFPWPGTWTMWDGKRLNIIRAEAGLNGARTEPGQVFTCDSESFCVSAGGGALRVKALQPEGKREMTAQEFLRGYKNIIGATLN